MYVLFRILADGKIFGADADLNKIDDIFYEIIRVIRNEDIGVLEYNIDNDQSAILIKRQDNGRLIATISAGQFNEEALHLLEKIQNSNSGTFAVEETELFMGAASCNKLKAPSTDKSDITIDIYDVRAGYSPRLGFSIKSQLGSASTLINSSKTTNFIYKISGDMRQEFIDLFNENSRRLRSNLFDMKEEYEFEFCDIDNTIFKNNLVLMDSDLPEITANMLLEYYTNNKVRVVDALHSVEMENPMEYDSSNNHPFYKSKFKRLITASALGMLPANVWDDQTDATGGYIIVREDGEVLCYHLYNRNEFEEYLINSTRFETPSTSRHKFGKIYEYEGEHFIKLNLQVRFIK
jgi:hypothetical protein